MTVMTVSRRAEMPVINFHKTPERKTDVEEGHTNGVPTRQILTNHNAIQFYESIDTVLKIKDLEKETKVPNTPVCILDLFANL